jgi:hypothetical protein
MLLAPRRDDDEQLVLYGNVCCDASFEDEIESKRFRDRRDRRAQVEMRVADGALTGTARIGRDRYEFRLTSSAEYGRGLTLQDLAGVYTRSASPPGTTMTLRIEADGRLSGSSADGCTYTGIAQVPDATRNMAQLRVQMSSCGSSGLSRRQWNGAYTGLGVLVEDMQRGSIVFYHTLVGPTWFGPLSVER